jgi:Transmembrane secretion effector
VPIYRPEERIEGLWPIMAFNKLNGIFVGADLSRTLHAGAQIYGLLTACFGAGALIGALIAASLGKATWPILLVSAIGFGTSEVILAFQNTVIGAVLLLLITGIFYTMYTSNTNTIVQLATPGNLQGRVAGPTVTFLLAQMHQVHC